MAPSGVPTFFAAFADFVLHFRVARAPESDAVCGLIVELRAYANTTRRAVQTRSTHDRATGRGVW